MRSSRSSVHVIEAPHLHYFDYVQGSMDHYVETAGPKLEIHLQTSEPN